MEPVDTAPTPLISKRSIQEFWIDFLLEEEFSVDPDFLARFLAACDFGLVDPHISDVRHSVSDRFGEADLVVIFNHGLAPNIERGALLIEDKINASFQPRQAERYAHRGEDGVNAGRWTGFRTVLVAPRAYISSAHGFDVAVPLEDVADWICESDPKRGDFRRRRLQAAIVKKNATGVQNVDEAMTNFRLRMFEYVQRYNAIHGSAFAVPKPRITYYDDNWFTVNEPTLLPKAEFRYLSRTGIVDLWFKDTPLEALALLAPHLPSGVILIAKGKYKQHAALQVQVEPISDFSDFNKVEPLVDKAFSRILNLLEFYTAKRVQIDAAVEASRKG